MDPFTRLAGPPEAFLSSFTCTKECTTLRAFSVPLNLDRSKRYCFIGPRSRKIRDESKTLLRKMKAGSKLATLNRFVVSLDPWDGHYEF